MHPLQYCGRGLFISHTLLHHSQNAPPSFTEVQRLHWGYFIISIGWNVQFVHSYPGSRFPRGLRFDLRLRASIVAFPMASLERPMRGEASLNNLRSNVRRFLSSTSGVSLCGMEGGRRSFPHQPSDQHPKVSPSIFGFVLFYFVLRDKE